MRALVGGEDLGAVELDVELDRLGYARDGEIADQFVVLARARHRG